MYIRLNSRRGQNTAEYAILIGVIVAAAIAMQVYVRRGMQARIKEAVDYTRTADNGTTDIFNMTQYEPYYSSQAMTQTQSARQSEESRFGGITTRNTIQQIAQVSGNQIAGNYMMGN